MKKYLISIETADSARLSKFYAQRTFCHYKDDFKQFGIIGKKLSAAEYFEQGVAAKAKAMTPGELGCSLSHLKALEDFLATNEKHAIIFEDDAIERFELDLEELAHKVEQLNLDSCFFLSLGGIQMKVCRKTRGTILSCQLYEQKILKVDHDFLENLSYAYAYLVDRKMAELLLAYHQPLRIYDHWKELVSMKQQFSFYATLLFEHPVIEHNIGLSHLEQERAAIKFTDNNTDQSIAKYVRKTLKKYALQKYE